MFRAELDTRAISIPYDEARESMQLHTHLGKQVLFAHLAFPLPRVQPDQPCEIVAGEHELRPVLSSFGIPLIRSRAPEREGQTDDKTEHGEEDIGHGNYSGSETFWSSEERGSSNVRLVKYLETQVIRVAHARMKVIGRTISGRILPCRRIKTGHLECLSVSRGPI